MAATIPNIAKGLIMGYIPPKPRDRLTGGRVEFVMTWKGWHHCWSACTNPKKCKWLGAAGSRKLGADY